MIFSFLYNFHLKNKLNLGNSSKGGYMIAESLAYNLPLGTSGVMVFKLILLRPDPLVAVEYELVR